MAATVSDGPLALARRQLEHAVAALADPVPVWSDGVCRWADPVYLQLRCALTGKPTRRRGPAHGSRSPCSIAVLELLIAMDATVARWEPHAKSTVDRLHQLAARSFRPQDCGQIDGYCAQLQQWAVVAAELLDREAKVFLPMPCPRCGARVAYRSSTYGERVRSRALRVTSSGCTCLACGATWGPDQFHWLARLLGCPVLPGVKTGP